MKRIYFTTIIPIYGMTIWKASGQHQNCTIKKRMGDKELQR